jgi:small subunit ribosomal protein S2
MPVETMKALLEAGVHFGHRTRRWNPKMKPFIFTERNGIHILDLQQTLRRLEQSYNLVRDTISDGGTLLFVGTKKQAQDTLAEEANRCGMPFVNQRWLGGTLTNWRTIRQRIDYLLDLEKKQMRGEFARLPKKEVSQLEYEIIRLNRRLGGLKDMHRLPKLLFVVDVRRETLAVKEANILNVPIIGMVDTNCDPTQIDYVIPSNDDAIRAIRLLVGKMADAVIEGQQMRESMMAEEEGAAEKVGEEEMARYLGPSTLAKLRATAPEEVEEAVAEAVDEEATEPEGYAPHKGFTRRQAAERNEGPGEEEEGAIEEGEEEPAEEQELAAEGAGVASAEEELG